MIAAKPNRVQDTGMKVLGIESSCDETGVAVYDTTQTGAAGLRAHAVYSQIALHAEYGGVVPELASRDHVRKLLPLIRQTLAEAGLGMGDIDGVAYTAGPGLVGALLVGAGVARSLAWALDVPAIGVHHMEGHLLAPLMEDDAPQPPFVALLVSGGPAVSGRAATGQIGRIRHAGGIQVFAAHDRPPGAGFQLQRAKNPSAAGMAGVRSVGTDPRRHRPWV